MNPEPKTDLRTKRVTFDHERLDVYQFELQFISWVTPLIEEAKEIATGKTREVCEQLDRASLSALLNEGNGKRQGQIRAKFFDDARGSATECAACLDALVAKQVCNPERIFDGKSILLRIVAMLCSLVDRFDGTAMRMHDGIANNPSNPSPAVIPEPLDYTESRRRTRRRRRRISPENEHEK
jgi:four helix bundle protein